VNSTLILSSGVLSCNISCSGIFWLLFACVSTDFKASDGNKAPGPFHLSFQISFQYLLLATACRQLCHQIAPNASWFSTCLLQSRLLEVNS